MVNCERFFNQPVLAVEAETALAPNQSAGSRLLSLIAVLPPAFFSSFVTAGGETCMTAISPDFFVAAANLRIQFEIVFFIWGHLVHPR